ncbi:hypothetical protein GCM10027031_20230 [Corynebacterium atrinae]
MGEEEEISSPMAAAATVMALATPKVRVEVWVMAASGSNAVSPPPVRRLLATPTTPTLTCLIV